MASPMKAIQKAFYPFDSAVRLAAEQNAIRDIRLGYHSAHSYKELDPKVRTTYVNYARKKLKETSENDLPTYPDVKHICVHSNV